MYNLALTTHVIGIVMMAGTTFVDFLILNIFRKTYRMDRSRALVLENFAGGLQKFLGIGMLLIILSGIGMMVYLHGVWGQQIWFKIKMVVLLLIIVNGLGFRRILGIKLRQAIHDPESQTDSLILSLTTRISIVTCIQIVFFLTVFTLSIFKIN